MLTNRRSLLPILLAAVAGLLFVGQVRGQGLILVHDIEHIAPVPPTLLLRQHKVEVSIDGQVATTKIEHVFYNPCSARVEGTFVLPLPAESHLERFAMDIAGKETEAELLDAAKARQIYEDIVRKTLDPALLEYSGHDLLKARVFPIEPHSEKRITVSYSHLLKQDGGVVAYQYPLRRAIATERVAPPTPPVGPVPMPTPAPRRHVAPPRPEAIAPSDQPWPFAIKIDLKTPHPIANLYSPTHAVEIKRADATHATIGYESANVTEGGFELLYSLAAGDQPVGLTLLTYQPQPGEKLDPADSRGYFMLLASPSFKAANETPIPKDIVLVLDTSGSMAGGKLEQAAKAFRFCIANLNHDDRFNVLRFSTEAEPLFDGLKPATKENCKAADTWVKTLKPRGGTAIDSALHQALEAIPNDEQARPRFVVFLTDGLPTVGETREDSIVAKVRDSFGRTRVFCFGIGHDVNTHLLDKVTETTRAASEYVLPDEDIEVKVSRFYTKIDSPVMTELALRSIGPLTLSKTYPIALPDLFRGEQVVAVGRVAEPPREAQLAFDTDRQDVELTGTIGDKRVSFSVPLAKAGQGGAFIPRLWATRRVGYLLDQIRLHGESNEVKQEVVELARAFGIVTPYTSYLIVEDELARGVSVARQSLRDVAADREDRDEARRQFEEMATAKSGEGAVGGARSNISLKQAAQVPAATQVANAEAGRSARRQVVQQTRFAGGRAFVQNGEEWIDARLQAAPKDLPTQEVTFNSEEYFKLLRDQPQLSQWLSVGRNVQVQLADRVLVVR